MMPGGVGGQAAHGHRPRETAVDEERTTFFQQIDEAIQSTVGEVRQPRGTKFVNAILGKHEQTPSRQGGFRDRRRADAIIGQTVGGGVFPPLVDAPKLALRGEKFAGWVSRSVEKPRRSRVRSGGAGTEKRPD